MTPLAPQSAAAYWHPIPTDDSYLARLRSDYPEDAGMSDEALRGKYAEGARYAQAGLWDHTGDAYHDYEKLADDWLRLRAMVESAPTPLELAREAFLGACRNHFGFVTSRRSKSPALSIAESMDAACVAYHALLRAEKEASDE